MANRYLVVLYKIRDDQLAEIKQIARSYQVIDARYQIPYNLNWAYVEIILGWHKDLERLILAADHHHLKWIQAISAGIESFDLVELSKKNIRLTNGGGIHSIPIAESVFGMLLVHYRGLRQALLQQTQKSWHSDIPYGELHGKTICLVGTGHIGSKVAQLSRSFGMYPICINRSGQPHSEFDHLYPIKDLQKILPTSDIVVNSLPATPSTYHLFDNDIFNAMKKGSTFVNVGRGSTVNTDALRKALATEHLAYAAIDVVEHEPLSPEDSLWSTPNLFITPHISGQAAHFKNRLMAIFTEHLSAFLKDGSLPRNQVSLETGY